MRFPLFLAAAFLSLMGDWLTTVAVGVVLFESTGSSIGPALFVVVRTVPRLLGLVVGGALGDHFRPERVMATVLGLQGLIAVLLYAATSRGSAVLVLAAVGASQLLGSGIRPIQQALIPTLVGRNQVAQATGLFAAGYGVTMFAAPALGVALLHLKGPALLVGIDGVTFVLAMAIFWALSTWPSERIKSSKPFTLRTALDALPPMVGDGVLRTALASGFGTALVVGAVQASLVVMAADRFGGPDNSGFLYAAVGVGGIVTSLRIAASASTAISRDRLFSAAATTIIALGCIAATGHIWIAAALLGVSALGSARSDVWSAAEVARRVDPAMLGRSNSVLVFAGMLGILIGASAASVLNPTVGWPVTVFGTSVVALTLTFAIAISGPSHAGHGQRAPHEAAPEH